MSRLVLHQVRANGYIQYHNERYITSRPPDPQGRKAEWIYFYSLKQGSVCRRPYIGGGVPKT